MFLIPFLIVANQKPLSRGAFSKLKNSAKIALILKK